LAVSEPPGGLAFADKNVGELVLIGVLLTGSVLAGLLYTFLARKLKQQGIAGPGS
jgi:hypothetical protein